MSASAIKDGFITQLSAASAFGTNGVSTNYRILEQTAGSCLVISWINLDSTPLAYGTTHIDRVWTFSVEIFLKDTGDPIAVLNRPFAAIDTIVSALEDNPTVQGTCEEVPAIRAFHRPSEFRQIIDAGGNTWLMFNIEIDLREWPGG